MKWHRLVVVFIFLAVVFVLGAHQLNSGYAASPTGQYQQAAPTLPEDPGLVFNVPGVPIPKIVSNPFAQKPGTGQEPTVARMPQADTTCGGVFNATADSFVRESQPGDNFGDQSLLVSQSSRTGMKERILLQFDPAGSVPEGATIQKAELELTLYQDPEPLTITLQTFSQGGDWDESTVTWSSQPTTKIDFDPVSFAITQTQPANSIVRLDVTTWAILWASGEITRTGLTVAPAGSPDMAASFFSKELERGSYPPRLVIYCIPDKTVIPLDSAPGDVKQLAGLTRLRQASLVTPTLQLERGTLRFGSFQVEIPEAISETGIARAEWFTKVYSDVIRLNDPDNELQLVRRSPDDRHLFFRQLHMGIPVYPSEIGVHLDGDQVTGVTGGVVPEITVDPTPRLTAEQAETIALATAAPGILINGDTQLAYLNLGLVGAPDQGTYLAWRVNLSNGTAVFIDANSGAVLYEQDDSSGGYHLDLNTGNHDGPSKTCCYWHWPPWSSTWWGEAGKVSTDIDAEGLQAWYAIRDVWNFWFWSFNGLNSYDNDGAEVEMYVHVGWFDGVAHWLPDCDYMEFTDGSATTDIVGHEYTHAVIDRLAGVPSFEYSWWSGALEESFADIFGNFAENQDDWFIGEDDPLITGRSMSNPDRDHMDKTACPSGEDKGCVHFNNGVHNKAAFLITKGGQFNGYDMKNGIGRTKAIALFYDMLYQLTSNADFMQARNVAVGVGRYFVNKHLANFTNQDVCIILRAYASVGLGNGDGNCDGWEDTLGPDTDYDFILDSKDNCISTPNVLQADFDNDGLGDACDPNSDGDAYLDHEYTYDCSSGWTDECNDNCPFTYQTDQWDWNGNAIGDACEESDGDKIMDDKDNCQSIYNPDQVNSDMDSKGDICDEDDDNDGFWDFQDNCSIVSNPSQTDSENDGVGDACDLCPYTSSIDNGDPDHDGLGNPCDKDDDNDGILDDGDQNKVIGLTTCKAGNTVNCDDNCREVKNFNQYDWNKNGVGSACEPGDHPSVGIKEEAHTGIWLPGEAFEIPMPGAGDHPNWGIDYLDLGFKEVVVFDTNVDVFAKIVDSSGKVLAKTRHGGDMKNQVLAFEPAPFAFMGGMQSRTLPGDTPAQSARVIPPSTIQYYLQLMPVETTPSNETFTVTLTIDGGMPNYLYLPLVLK